MLVRVTGSQLDRIHRCETSAALPQIIDANDEDNEARERGTAVHKFLERVPQVGRDEALLEVDAQHRAICSDIELTKISDLMSLSTEVALAYNWVNDSARRLTPVAHRAYEIDPSCEVAMTLDVVGVSESRVYVGDYKGAHAWLPAPEQSYQLAAGAVALARLYRKDVARVEYIRIRDDGTPRRFDAELDFLALEGAAERIRELMSTTPERRAAILRGETPDVVEGPWCKYCPSKDHCPARTALIRQVMTPEAPDYSVAITPENAAQVYATLKRAKGALAQIEGALYAYAKATPIPLGEDEDGSLRFFGELRRQGNEELDGAIAHQVLTELYGGEAANKAVSMETTKRAIGDVVRANLKPGEKVTTKAEEVYELVRARNGSHRKTTTSTTEYTVDAEGEAKARKRKAS
jgi:hypothetical protein